MEVVKSRREEYAEATRAALLDAGLHLFVSGGYAATSIEQIAAAARVTKGAFYHHFAGKQALLVELAGGLDRVVAARVLEAFRAAPDLWEGAMAGLDVYLGACVDPAFGLLVHRELPPLIGPTSWAEVGEQEFGGLMRLLMTALVEDGIIRPYPVQLTTRMLFAALAEASLAIAQAADPLAERDAARAIVVGVMTGLRAP